MNVFGAKVRCMIRSINSSPDKNVDKVKYKPQQTWSLMWKINHISSRVWDSPFYTNVPLVASVSVDYHFKMTNLAVTELNAFVRNPREFKQRIRSDNGY